MTGARLKEWLGATPLPRWLQRRDAPAVAVLMYHDLCDDGDLANWMRVPRSRFAAQLDACAELGAFVHPADLEAPERLPRDRLGFLVTFDDGYANNARLAAPLLAARKIPALFCVSTAPLVSQEPFWTDLVVTPLQARAVAELDLGRFGLGVFRFRAGPPAVRWDDIQRLLVAIKAVGNDDHPQVAAILAWFRDTYAAELREHLPRFRPLHAEELARLAAEPRFVVASHGHEHRILTRLTDDALAATLARSRDLLVSATGQPVTQLAYPNGDHDARVRAATAQAGFRLAYTTRSSLAAGRQDPFALPRIAVGGFDSPALLRFLVLRRLATWRSRERGRGLELAGAGPAERS